MTDVKPRHTSSQIKSGSDREAALTVQPCSPSRLSGPRLDAGDSAGAAHVDCREELRSTTHRWRESRASVPFVPVFRRTFGCADQSFGFNTVRHRGRVVALVSRQDQQACAHRVAAHLHTLLPLRARMELHAGDTYVRDLAPLLRATGRTVSLPLQGARIGHRLHWYTQKRGAPGSARNR